MDHRDKRAHPRVELAAEIRLTPGSAALTFATSNISMGGVFAVGDPGQHPELKVGVHVQLRICVGDARGGDISCRAQITRVDQGQLSGNPAGFALRFFRLDMATTMRLAKLIDRGQG